MMIKNDHHLRQQVFTVLKHVEATDPSGILHEAVVAVTPNQGTAEQSALKTPTPKGSKGHKRTYKSW